MKNPFVLTRMIDPSWRAKHYVDMRSGMPDPAREARLARLRQITARRVIARDRRA